MARFSKEPGVHGRPLSGGVARFVVEGYAASVRALKGIESADSHSSMSTLSIYAEKTICTWKDSIAFGLSVALVLTAIFHNIWPADDFDGPSSAFFFAVLAGVAITFALATQRRSIALIASEPPTLVTTRTWFRKFGLSKQQSIQDAAWVRVNYLEDMHLVIEIVTHGYQTKTVASLPYSEENIPISEELCANVAQLLSLSNRGTGATCSQVTFPSD